MASQPLLTVLLLGHTINCSSPGLGNFQPPKLCLQFIVACEQFMELQGRGGGGCGVGEARLTGEWWQGRETWGGGEEWWRGGVLGQSQWGSQLLSCL